MADASAVPIGALQMEREWKTPDRGVVGILMLIVTETSLFSMFAAAYLIYIGRSVTGPYPKDVLEIPILATICLWSSSLTVWLAEHSLIKGELGRFRLWLTVTILLGLEFLTATGLEWKKLIFEDHLTISTNLFGTTFYSLVGLHASHVCVGLFFLITVLIVSLRGFPMATQSRRFVFLSWYWHFVDGIWVVVFSVVYLIGR